jgi:hypothetical protein
MFLNLNIKEKKKNYTCYLGPLLVQPANNTDMREFHIWKLFKLEKKRGSA